MDWQVAREGKRSASSESRATFGRDVATPKARAFTLTATSLGFVVVQLDVTIVNVALQRIGSTFGAGVASLQWIVDAYTLVFASFILTAGALGDRLGAKRVFTTGFLIFTAGSAVCGLASDMPVLIVGRVIQGIGAAVLVPCSLALLHNTFRDEKGRAKAVAVWAAGASVALAAGPVVGGVLINIIGWRTIFFINLPLGAIGIWLTLKYADESPQTRSRGLDLAGQLATIVGLASLATAAIESSRLGLGSPAVIGAGVAFVVCAIAFIRTEARSSSPMLPLGLFRNSTFSAAILTGLLINIAYYGLIFLFSLFFQQGKSYSPLLTGTAFLPMTAGVLGANLAAGHMTAHRGPRAPMLIGLALFAVGCVLLVLVTPATSFLYMGGQMLLMGVGVGFVVPPMTAAVLSAVARSQAGVASGALNATRQAGSVIGVALYGALIADKARLTQGTHMALYISTALLLIGCAATARYVKAHPKPHGS
jgi:DHA2 family methylenomycin A resistance protein-like MFS transporter